MHRAGDAARGTLPAAPQVDGRAGGRRMVMARNLVQSKLYQIEMSLRGFLRGFRLKSGARPIESGLSPVQESKVLPPPCYISIVSDCGNCFPGCKTNQKRWQEWLEKQFKGFYLTDLTNISLSEPDLNLLQEHQRRFGGKTSITQLPLGILDLSQGHERYWERIGPKSRNMVRKAEKQGYNFALFKWDDHLDDIFEINTSMEERGGKPMTERYRSRPAPSSSDPYCAEQQYRYYGAFKDQLYAYLVLVVCGHFGIVNTILGHGEHLRAGIMNGLLNFVVRDLASSGHVRYVNYLTLRSGRQTLESFKRHVGFEERTAVFLSDIDPGD
jgi:hypothetical protein